MGETNNGHYFSIIKNFKNSRWYFIDDEDVGVLESDEMVRSALSRL